MPSSPINCVLDNLAGSLTDEPDALLLVAGGDRRGLADALAMVPDPRRRRGVRYPFVPLLSVAVCAMLAGARSFAAIAEWVADLSEAQRSEVGVTGAAPAVTTIWRVLVSVDASALQAAIGAWIRAQLDQLQAVTGQVPTSARGGERRARRVLAVDGKAMRATRHGDDPVHLLAALDHGKAVVVAQADVNVKTNEIACFTTVPGQIEDLTDVVITVDAMHAQTGHATYLHARRAHLLVTVKRNQPTLHQQLKALPWKDIPAGHTACCRAHGRIEKRILKAVTVPGGLGFPHAAQAIQVVRRTRRISTAPGKRARWHTETVYAICTLPAQDAQPAELATWIRGHWRIENQLHWVRDVTLCEDLHQARTGSGPQVMAILRNLVISLLRFAGHHNIARALRRCARHPGQAIALVMTGTTVAT
jgi:predicted transposase YbfD/YdcC